MSSDSRHDAWSSGENYERYMGRWSRRIAVEFLRWLTPPPAADWVEVGCGTGALSEAILQIAAPRTLRSIDTSPDFVAHARRAIPDMAASFQVADALSLPFEDGSADVVASALVLNFVPDKQAALREMLRVLRPGGLLSFYVWDYPGGGIGFISAFWNAAASLDPSARDLGEGRRFPFCTRDGLAELCVAAGVPSVEIVPIETTCEFEDFEAFWTPFTLGAGPAPGYVASLSDEAVAALKARLAETVGKDGPVRLPARAWAARSRISR